MPRETWNCLFTATDYTPDGKKHVIRRYIDTNDLKATCETILKKHPHGYAFFGGEIAVVTPLGQTAIFTVNHDGTVKQDFSKNR